MGPVRWFILSLTASSNVIWRWEVGGSNESFAGDWKIMWYWCWCAQVNKKQIQVQKEKRGNVNLFSPTTYLSSSLPSEHKVNTRCRHSALFFALASASPQVRSRLFSSFSMVFWIVFPKHKILHKILTWSDRYIEQIVSNCEDIDDIRNW